MTREEYSRFEQKLAFHAAPTLLGIKASNMLSLSHRDFDIAENINRFNERAAAKGLHIEVLCECKNKALMLVYNRRLLEKRLADPVIRRFLTVYGYSEELKTDGCLHRLAQRMKESDGFPHEVGIFLDYPLEDVIGFIENAGANYKLCGCHKVYGDAVRAARVFSNYEKCRNFLCGRLNTGHDIYQALKIN